MEMSGYHDPLVDRLIADARPVRPRRLRRLFSTWALIQATVLVALVWHGLRPDIATAARRPLFVAEIVMLAISGTLAAWLTVRAAFPDDRAPGSGWGATVAVLGACGLIPFAAGTHTAPMSLETFVATGSPCFLMTVTIAAAPWVGLMLLIRRGASVIPGRAGLFAGLAAFLVGAAAMRAVCPLEDPMHLLSWHGLPLVLGAGLSSVLGAALLGAWAVSRTLPR